MDAEKNLEEPFCEESSILGLLMVLAEESFAGAVLGDRTTIAPGQSRPDHLQCLSARAGNHLYSVISLSFLPCLNKLPAISDTEGRGISSRNPGMVRGLLGRG